MGRATAVALALVLQLSLVPGVVMPVQRGAHGVGIGSDDPPESAEDAPADASDLIAPAIGWRGQAGWQIRTPSSGSRVTEAYADAPSYLPGDTLRLNVSTSAPFYSVSIWRVGESISRLYSSPILRGRRQTATVIDPATSLIRADWVSTFQFRLPAMWETGIYLARVAGVGGAQSYVKFVVRSAAPSPSILFVVNALTDAAYNMWGGASLYQSSIGSPFPGIDHAVEVSLDRPSLLENGAGLLFVHELPLAAWLERQGYSVTYTTDWDLSLHPNDQAVPKAVFIAGHSEYWGRPLRSWLDDLVLDQGTMSLGVFASNTGYWPVEISADGRTITCYKELLTKPGYGGSTDRLAGSLRTLRFRELPNGDPDARNWPEQALFGVQYGSLTTVWAPYVLGTELPATLLAGTGLTPGTSIGTIAGGETDAVDNRYTVPTGQVVIADATGFPDRYGSAARATAVMRTDPSGARVFAAGTPWWPWGLDPGFAASHYVPAGFAQLTRNIVDGLVGH